jgi:outer membrane protein OmpA-like peptidoglycan-associated protein
MPSRQVRWALAGVAFVALWLIAVAVSVPAMEDDLTGRVERQLAAAGIQQVAVDFDGRDGTLRGPEALRDPSLAAVTDRDGIRSLEYAVGEAAPTTTTTLPGQVTVPPVATTTPGTTTSTTTSTSTSTTTSTTTTTTTTTTTAPLGPPVDATATIGDQSIRLEGFIADEDQHQALLTAAATAFTPQGEVIDELGVPAPSPDAAESQSAVQALAEAIAAAGPTLASGTFRATPGNLALADGEAFSQAAADRLEAALADIGARNGVSIDAPLSSQETDEDTLQSTLDTVVGRAGITFASGSAEVEGPSEAVLDSVAEVLDEVPDPPIEVRGHTDSSGPAGPNQALSEQRAAAVVDELVARGVEEDRLTATGAGETEPIAPNDTEEGRARNRRIELIVREGG